MTASLYLFDVNHGQCLALRLPAGRWCIFDVGCTGSFSPIQWIAGHSTHVPHTFGLQPRFRFLKATVSHLHGDHIADFMNLFLHGTDFLKTVEADSDYINDCYATCADASAKAKVNVFFQSYRTGFSPAASIPDYGGVIIRELCLPVAVARSIGGDANARVNNASIVTRIDLYGNSILICGDLEKEAWAAIIKDTGEYGRLWRPLLDGIDLLIAPHHGHRSGYSVELMNLAQPAVVLVSAVTRDPNVDSRYSQSPVRGITIGGTSYGYISTRQKGHIKVEFHPPAQPGFGQKGGNYWTFGEGVLR